MIRRGNSNKQTSVVNAPIQNDTLTGREGIVRTSAPENLNAVYESTNFEVDLSGQLTTRKALRPCSGDFRSGIQLFDGYVLTKDPSSGEYAIKSNADASYSGAVAVAYVDYATSEEAPETTLDALSGALDLAVARCEASGSIAYISNIGVYTSKWTPSAKPFSSDASGRVTRLATIRKAEGSDSKWILRIITPEIAVPEDASDGNGFDPNLYGDNPYAIRDAYNYGSLSVRGIFAYKAKAPHYSADYIAPESCKIYGLTALFTCVQTKNTVWVYANHTMSYYKPSQIRNGISGISIDTMALSFKCFYNNSTDVYTYGGYAASMLYIPKGTLVLYTDTSRNDAPLTGITVAFSMSNSHDVLYVIPDEYDIPSCPDSALSTYSIAKGTRYDIATLTKNSTGVYTLADFEHTLERRGFCATRIGNVLRVSRRTPCTLWDASAHNTLQFTSGSATYVLDTLTYGDHVDVPVSDNIVIQPGCVFDWGCAYKYAKDTSVRQLTEFGYSDGCGVLASVNASDFNDVQDVLVLKALMTFPSSFAERYLYWERSTDGVNWETVPEFLQQHSQTGLLRNLRVVDATQSNETLDSAYSYARYVSACPVPRDLSADDALLCRPDVLVIPKYRIASAIRYKYRVVCVERAPLENYVPNAYDTYVGQHLVRCKTTDSDVSDACPAPVYEEGPIVSLTGSGSGDSSLGTCTLAMCGTDSDGALTFIDSAVLQCSNIANAPEFIQASALKHTFECMSVTPAATQRLYFMRTAGTSDVCAYPLECTLMICTQTTIALVSEPMVNANCKGAASGASATLSCTYAATFRNRTDVPVRVHGIVWAGKGDASATYSATFDKPAFGYAAYSVDVSTAPSTAITLSAGGTSDNVRVKYTHADYSLYQWSVSPILQDDMLPIQTKGRLLCPANSTGNLTLTCTSSYTVGTSETGTTLSVDDSTLDDILKNGSGVTLHVRGFSDYSVNTDLITLSDDTDSYSVYVPGKALRRISIWQPTQTAVTYGPYTFDLANKTDTLSTASLNIGMCNILEHNEVFLAYGEYAKNKVYVSEAGTMIFPNSLAIESRSGADVTGMLKWRSHIIMTTKSSIELLTYDSETGTYAVRTLSATMGVSEDDANALQALPNSFILRSGSAVYSMSPSMYSGSDELLYTNLISAKLGDALSDKSAICSWLDRSANAYHMLCKGNVDYVYDYARKLWWSNVYTPSVKGVSYISGDPYLACGFADDNFGTVLYRYDTSLYGSGDGRYVDTYWEGTDASPRLAESRIPLSVTWKDRCSKPTLDKQWLELKYTVARHNGLKHISDECLIGVGGEILTRTLDPNASMSFAASEDAYANGLGALSANAFQTSGKIAGGNLDQMFVKFSGRGKTATLTIEPTSDDRITLHSAELRWRTLPNKQ
jgi:hypothetical protein